ncbi:MAG: stage III sporulation protein AB [Acutalibacteraceae bacterium]
MKYIGAAVMPALVSFYSVILSLRLRKRADILDKTYSLLNEMKIMLEYYCLSVNELIDAAYEKSCYQKTFIIQCKKLLTDGNDFPVAWSASVESAGIYKKEEKQKLIQLGEFLGTSDLESQLTVMQMYITDFDEFRKDAQNKRKKYADTSIFVGAFCALGLFVMMV